MILETKKQKQKRMWKELKELEDEPLYAMATAVWWVNEYSKSFKCKILKFINKLRGKNDSAR